MLRIVPIHNEKGEHSPSNGWHCITAIIAPNLRRPCRSHGGGSSEMCVFRLKSKYQSSEILACQRRPGQPTAYKRSRFNRFIAQTIPPSTTHSALDLYSDDAQSEDGECNCDEDSEASDQLRQEILLGKIFQKENPLLNPSRPCQRGLAAIRAD